MARPKKLLIDKLRSRAWLNSFFSELQGITQRTDEITPSEANRILDRLLSGEIKTDRSMNPLNTVFPDEDMIPNYTSHFHRWKSGKRCVSSTNRLIQLFEFSQDVYTTGIPQSPSMYNVRVPDDEFETFTPEEAAKGKAIVFDFAEALPLWISIKGTPSQILEAWRLVTRRAWIFWHPDSTSYDLYEINLSSKEWDKTLPYDHYSFKDESQLAYTLERVSENPVPPIVNLTSQIAAARLVGDRFVCLGPHFPSNKMQIELTPFGIELDEIWDSLDEVGCPPRFI